jgi:hypothetical protein
VRISINLQELDHLQPQEGINRLILLQNQTRRRSIPTNDHSSIAAILPTSGATL